MSYKTINLSIPRNGFLTLAFQETDEQSVQYALAYYFNQLNNFLVELKQDMHRNIGSRGKISLGVAAFRPQNEWLPDIFLERGRNVARPLFLKSGRILKKERATKVYVLGNTKDSNPVLSKLVDSVGHARIKAKAFANDDLSELFGGMERSLRKCLDLIPTPFPPPSVQRVEVGKFKPSE